MAPHATQTRKHVLELSKLNLETALVRLGVYAKDVEDEGRAIDDLDGFPYRTLEVGLLRGGQLVVEDDNVGGEVSNVAAELLDLALTDECLRYGRVEPLRHREDDLGAIRLGEASELGERLLTAPLGAPKVDAHENRALRHGGGGIRLEACHLVPFQAQARKNRLAGALDSQPVHLEPAYASVAAEPRELTLGVASRPTLDELDRFLERRGARQDLE